LDGIWIGDKIGRSNVGALMVEEAASDERRREERHRKPGFLKVFDEWQSVVTTISVFFAVIGVVLGALSSYFTYRQLQMFNAERDTPYRAIVYNSELDAYRQESGIVDFYIQTARLTYASFSEKAAKGIIDPDAINQATKIDKLYDDLYQKLTATKVVWPRSFDNHYTALVEAASQYDVCAEFLVEHRVSLDRVKTECAADQLEKDYMAVRRAAADFRDDRENYIRNERFTLSAVK
jgi:hypothetical protein